METTFTPLDSPAIYARDEEKNVHSFYSCLPQAGRARLKPPAFLTGFKSTQTFRMGCMWVLLPRFPLQSDHNSNSGSSRTDWEPLISHHLGGIILSSFLQPIVRKSLASPSTIKVGVFRGNALI